MGEKKHFICQNPTCKTTFTTPLKTINLQENPIEPYFACPFCLTKIPEEEPNLNSSTGIPEKGESTQTPKIEYKNVTENNLHCKHHLGYLGERRNNEQIPDDCFVCKNIIECMLKKAQ